MSVPAFSLIPQTQIAHRDAGVICAANRHTNNTNRSVDGRSPTAISIDWVHITLPERLMTRASNLISAKVEQPWQSSKLPTEFRSAYRCAMRCGAVQLYFQNRYQHHTCCLVFPASANPTGCLALIAQLLRLGGKVRRMDIAFDDRRGVLPIDTIRDAWTQGKAVTHFRRMRTIEDYGRGGNRTAYGVNFGSRSSSSYLRVYDKSLEQAGGTGELAGHVRYELELKNDEAHALMGDILCDDPEDVSSSPRVSKRDFSDEGLVAHALMGDILCYDSEDDSWSPRVSERDFPNEGLVARFRELALETLKSKLSFRERQATTNVSRAQPVWWWDELLEYFDAGDERAKHQPVSTDDEEAWPRFHDLRDWEEVCQQATQRKRKERAARNRANELLSELYGSFKRSFSDDWRQDRDRIPKWEDPPHKECAEFRPKLRLVVNNPGPGRPGRNPLNSSKPVRLVVCQPLSDQTSRTRGATRATLKSSDRTTGPP